MQWNSELTLIKITPPENPTNENGFPNPGTETATTVFANIKSVGMNEFYKASVAGFDTALKFDVWTDEYDKQTIAEYMGERYNILRTYLDPKTGETIELTLSNLPQEDNNG